MKMKRAELSSGQAGTRHAMLCTVHNMYIAIVCEARDRESATVQGVWASATRSVGEVWVDCATSGSTTHMHGLRHVANKLVVMFMAGR